MSKGRLAPARRATQRRPGSEDLARARRWVAYVCATMNLVGRSEAEGAALEPDPALGLLHFESANEWVAHICAALNLVALTDEAWAALKAPPALAFLRCITVDELERIGGEIARADERLRRREAEPRGAAGDTEKFGGGPERNVSVQGPTRSPMKG